MCGARRWCHTVLQTTVFVYTLGLLAGGILASLLLTRPVFDFPLPSPCINILTGAPKLASAMERLIERQGSAGRRRRYLRTVNKHLDPDHSLPAGQPKPVAYGIQDLYSSDYGRAGLAHITVAGARWGAERWQGKLFTFAHEHFRRAGGDARLQQARCSDKPLSPLQAPRLEGSGGLAADVCPRGWHASAQARAALLDVTAG